jgi:Phosphorylase superfamily
MVVDRKWVKRNIGFDPVERQPPDNTFAFKKAAVKSPDPDDLQREIIDFDSQSPEGLNFLAFTTATGLSAFTDIPWPQGLAPTPDKKPGKGTGGRLPNADVLVVTWTVDEGHALSRVLTPGFDSANNYVAYTRNFEQISKGMVPGCPARQAKRLGAYWTTKIGGKSVVVFKSESHISQDTKGKPTPPDQKIPNLMVWKQMIEDVQPKLVITTGTGGGIGKQFEVGDVIVSPLVNFFCEKAFKRLNNEHGSSVAPNTKNFAKATTLFKANADRLPQDNTRLPAITVVKTDDLKSCIVTTDFFGFDTSDNHYGLQGHGDLSEMGDAIVPLLAAEMEKAGQPFPLWVAVRNVSDPQIKAEGTLSDQANEAAHIYKAFGRWSSVCSAIVCWALIAAET